MLFYFVLVRVKCMIDQSKWKPLFPSFQTYFCTIKLLYDFLYCCIRVTKISVYDETGAHLGGS